MDKYNYFRILFADLGIREQYFDRSDEEKSRKSL
jgi:hypothetical protein